MNRRDMLKRLAMVAPVVAAVPVVATTIHDRERFELGRRINRLTEDVRAGRVRLTLINGKGEIVERRMLRGSA